MMVTKNGVKGTTDKLLCIVKSHATKFSTLFSVIILTSKLLACNQELLFLLRFEFIKPKIQRVINKF